MATPPSWRRWCRRIDVGLVNHYSSFQLKATKPDLAVANKYFGAVIPAASSTLPAVDPGHGRPTPRRPRLVDFLLSTEAQTYFAEETFEIPLVEGTAPVEGVPTLEDLTLPALDLNQLDDWPGPWPCSPSSDRLNRRSTVARDAPAQVS